MSDPGNSAARSGTDVPLWVVLLLVVLMIVGAGMVAYVVLNRDPDRPSGSSYPKAWDPRILPYVKAVEKQRGLTFLHPVPVRFLTGDAFEKGVTRDEEDLDAKERKEIEQFTGLMRAIGLVSGDVDLLAAFDRAHGSATLAYYSFDDRRITVRGTTLVPGVRATLVHELTHALEDQRFGLGKRYDELRTSKADSAATELSILDGISEGDASRVADLYKASLPAKQLRAVERGEKRDAKRAGDQLKGVPRVVLTIISSPYALGEALVATVAADSGNPGVDRLIRDSPTHESVLLDPFRQLGGHAGGGTVAAPELLDGEKEIDAGEFGAPQWYFMLAERMPLRTALAAADGWGADSYVAYDNAGTTCVRANYAGRTSGDTLAMYAALQRWARTSPASTVSGDSRVVTFQSCDPGTAAEGGRDASIDALNLAATRNFVGAALLKQGAPTHLARCVAGRFIDAFTVAQLADPKFGADDPSVRTRVQRMVAACR